MENTGLLFIHGAGLGGWIWRDVVANIGVPYVCADFPLRSEAKEARASLSLDDYVTSVLEQAATMQVDKIIVVAHSLGGVVAVKVASQLGDRLAGFVAVGAAIPKNGGSFLSALGFPKSFIMGTIMKSAGTQPPASAIKSGLCNDLNDELTKEVIDRFAAESLAIYNTKTNVALPEAPRLYITLTKDKEFGTAMQKRMASNLGGAVENIDTGHMPMLAKPADLRTILQAFASSL